MKTINKRRLLYCIILSLIINGLFFVLQYSSHEFFTKDGIIKELYVKSLKKNESTFLQKAKYTRVAKTFFITSTGDTVFEIRKNTWAMQVDKFEEMNFYIPLDSVIYNPNNPEDNQLISEFKNYSIGYSVLSYFIIGPIIFTIWLYLLTFIIAKGLERHKKDNSAAKASTQNW
jgi:hypothetical protein